MIGEQSRSTTPSTNEADVVHLSTKNHDLAAYATKNLITYGDTPMAFEWLGLSLLIQPGTVLYQILGGAVVSSGWVLESIVEGAIVWPCTPKSVNGYRHFVLDITDIAKHELVCIIEPSTWYARRMCNNGKMQYFLFTARHLRRAIVDSAFTSACETLQLRFVIYDLAFIFRLLRLGMYDSACKTLHVRLGITTW